MTRLRRTLVSWLCAWGCVCSLGASALAAEALRAKVVAFGSGSAFAVLDAGEKLKRVKLTGVDSPERTQRFGPQARRLAGEWLGAGSIDIAIDAIDAAGRIHGRVSVDGRDVGLALIDAGLAWCDPHDAASLPAQLRARYDEACARAKRARRGLWIDASPVPPWEHRRIPQFEPPPAGDQAAEKSCRDIGYNTLQCDDGKTYRSVGSQIVGSDGTVYSRRGNTVTDDAGNRYERRGTSIYGSDGTVCRTRGTRVDCY